MKYHGIYSTCEVKAHFSGPRFEAYYHHSTTFRGKNVMWWEVVEDDSPQPVAITRRNLKAFHLFFTKPQFI